ncbi:predicted protein [Sclerotinia sclerotiorum 1980 UF-70]|uniref:Uncharacterized protein n=1 Tax=Sclerotinia sclerotiorum (strain ATCC 18683 / 1980 / Ss-1) TaxID=665079 RepID=A7F3D9_SCLS1|nr:predicted protein [Sclerotinia sclerotiorum 1980 UF-70]EDN97260.1 predicted protein [Sclerotinia sclerotiorum 1980 UF-70]
MPNVAAMDNGQRYLTIPQAPYKQRHQFTAQQYLLLHQEKELVYGGCDTISCIRINPSYFEITYLPQTSETTSRKTRREFVGAPINIKKIELFAGFKSR